MNKIVTLAAVAALATLTACGVPSEAVDAPVDEATATPTDSATDSTNEASDAATASALVAPVGQQHQM